jgi:hypothetical protein
MNTEYELTALRSIREINIAIRDLENQQAAVTKRYKRGIKMLESEICTIEESLDDGGTIETMEPWTVRSPECWKLIADPQLDNIEDDNVV